MGHQRSIDINDKKTDERYQKILIDDRESDERDQISKNDEEKIIEDIEIMKLQNMISQKIYIYLEQESDEINPKDRSDKKYSDEREQISKNDEVKVSDIVEDLKVGKLSSHKYVDNVDTEPDKRYMLDISNESTLSKEMRSVKMMI